MKMLRRLKNGVGIFAWISASFARALPNQAITADKNLGTAPSEALMLQLWSRPYGTSYGLEFSRNSSPVRLIRLSSLSIDEELSPAAFVSRMPISARPMLAAAATGSCGGGPVPPPVSTKTSVTTHTVKPTVKHTSGTACAHIVGATTSHCVFRTCSRVSGKPANCNDIATWYQRTKTTMDFRTTERGGLSTKGGISQNPGTKTRYTSRGISRSTRGKTSSRNPTRGTLC